MDFNRYFTNEELAAQLTAWAEAYPQLLHLNELGKSQEGKSIWLATVTNKLTGPDTDKPAIYLDANLHATEIAGTTTTMRILFELLSQYGTNARVTKLLDTTTYYIVPRMNPDGAAWAMAKTPKFVRSGTRAYPFEDLAEGMHSQDVDGDGRILQMRIPDPNGDWKISTLNPRLMEKRRPDEHDGQYYRLLPEGLMEAYDGFQIKLARPLQGLDFNRNYPSGWRPENEQWGAGPYPASEPEVRAEIDFVAKHPNINAAITYHTYSGVILRPFSEKPDTDMDVHDLWTYQAIGERGSDLTGYKCVSVYHDFRYHPKEVITGAFDDWAYNHQGIYSFTIELWDIVGQAGITDRKFIEWMRKHPHEDDVKILEWAVENGLEEGYVDWYPFEHPQLGAVEIGGWDPFYTWRNPPHKFMGAEAERNVGFALALGEMTSRLEVFALKAQAIGDGVYHLNLVVDNVGFFPTFTSVMGRNRRVMRPVRVELELPETVILAQGKAKVELGHLEGRSNKNGVFSFGASGTDNRARAEWVLRAPTGAEISVNIFSDRAGSIQKKITLQ